MQNQDIFREMSRGKQATDRKAFLYQITIDSS